MWVPLDGGHRSGLELTRQFCLHQYGLMANKDLLKEIFRETAGHSHKHGGVTKSCSASWACEL